MAPANPFSIQDRKGGCSSYFLGGLLVRSCSVFPKLFWSILWFSGYCSKRDSDRKLFWNLILRIRRFPKTLASDIEKDQGLLLFLPQIWRMIPKHPFMSRGSQLCLFRDACLMFHMNHTVDGKILHRLGCPNKFYKTFKQTFRWCRILSINCMMFPWYPKVNIKRDLLKKQNIILVERPSPRFDRFGNGVKSWES